jgi:NADPH:quinone reductase-like Zn-dependent oxidoreductase
MRAMVVEEYGKTPALSEVPAPAGPTADVLAASLNPAGLTVAAGLNPFRRLQPPLVLGMDGVARQADGALVHFFAPAPPYGAFAERVLLAEAETVPLPGGLDASRPAALGISGVTAWTALAGTAALRPGESVLILGANGQVGRIAVQAARLLGARRVTGVVQHEAARQAPLWLGAGTVVTSQDLPTLTQRLLEADQRGYDVILDTLWGPVIPAAVGATATGARVVHLGNSAGALATLAGPAIRKNRVSILGYAIFTVPARERCDAFARLAEHAVAGDLTVDYRETALEALPAIWADFAAGQAKTRIIVTPNEATPS